MTKVGNYIKESYNELVHKVSWPSWEDLQSSAIVTLVASLIIALIIFGMDKLSNFVLSNFYQLFE